MESQKNIFHANNKQRRGGVVILRSDITDFKSKKVVRQRTFHVNKTFTVTARHHSYKQWHTL